MSTELELLEKRIVTCQSCGLWETCKQPISGSGDYTKTVLVIGEAPGQSEDEQHKPFVGSSGKKLMQLLGYAGLTRNEVYITNTVKCRPPENRTPTPREVSTCSKWLREQLGLFKPAYIVTLGTVATQAVFAIMFKEFTSITKLHGRFIDAQVNGIKFILFPTFHPASALYNSRYEEFLKKDFDALGHSDVMCLPNNNSLLSKT